MSSFSVDPAFEAGSVPVCDLRLSAVRLQADARFPWLILIPRRPGLVELEDLAPDDRVRLMEETVQGGRAVRALGEALGLPVTKLNLGALGNITRQLHLHMVGRHPADPCWPGPVWGQGTPEPMAAEVVARATAAVRAVLS